MTDFKTLAQMRRSHRKFTSEEIDAEDVKLILRAALMSPTSKGQRAWEFIVVDDKMDLEKLSDAKAMGGQFLKDAPLAIVVLGDPLANDCWVEDGSIAAISMQYQAEELGLGSCYLESPTLAFNVPAVAEAAKIPEGAQPQAVIVFGYTDDNSPHKEYESNPANIVYIG